MSKGTTTHEAVRGRLPPSSDGSTLVSLGITDKETVDKIILLWEPRCSRARGGGRKALGRSLGRDDFSPREDGGDNVTNLRPLSHRHTLSGSIYILLASEIAQTNRSLRGRKSRVGLAECQQDDLRQ